MKNIITGTDLLVIGFTKGKSLGLALQAVANTEEEKEVILAKLAAVLENPTAYAEDEIYSELVVELTKPKDLTIPLREKPLDYKIYGKAGIEDGALKQINTAMKLPIAQAGALMPDAHQGYGLPIGGVLATNDAIIPYAVGVDIGCRMCMTIYDLPTSMLENDSERLKEMLKNNTRFGRATFKKPREHSILENDLFKEIPLVKELKGKAYKQLGSSGGGNHFVEFGIADVTEDNNGFGVKKGKYLALLSHSGSRGFGATIANHYTKLAMKNCPLPQEARHLAWLDMNTELGMEYWLAMNLAGEYASACHHQIHERMAVGLRATPLAMIENHHNFAWKELDAHGNEVIVHRKGATPAGKGVLGIIPGSMTAPGFIVRGKGNVLSLNSAAHGAGRAMSRTAAKKTLDPSAVQKHLKDCGIELIGSGLDEAPMAYKNIHEVMEYQSDLVDVLGTFLPKIVRMCGDEKFMEVD